MIGVMREYVLHCEHTSGDVWTPEHLYAVDGRDERVVRCRNCRALDRTDIDWRDWCYCRNFREYVEPDGFCAWGEMKED